MLDVTSNAVDAIRRVIGKGDTAAPAAGLRIMVQAGGCAGYQYRMGLVAEAEQDDTVIDFEDVKVFVDAGSAPLLAGARLDFVEDISGSGFVFDNPQAADKCSCGKSFAA
ncbi:HesB/IscA family protein [Caenispirillum bisanense]|uniref:Iron-sulfur cluster assembly protein n=1 Tax=Caenispirillum bisanense TaxID=414052 RepID=A0A286GMS4_9PROT|nr:iron-sulfur cluster assembly accessory protein [Caenispirillum bisanense]SOD96855.1 iron-sulfur cluster assembly protein [Caenispirillum bisanense]